MARTFLSNEATQRKGRTMAGYATAHLDDIEDLPDAVAHYRPIRHRLGITAFGVTAWTARQAGDVVIDEHDEGDPTADEELFLVLRGHAVFEVDGDTVDAPQGTIVFAPPRTNRRASALADDTIVLAVEGTPGQAYEARGWELWAPLAPLYGAGEHAVVAERLEELVQVDPQYPMLWFNLACCESRCGRTSQALDHLERAVELSEEFREAARHDPDLDPVRDEPAFERLTRPSSAGEGAGSAGRGMPSLG
jgi:tetratricopeptide (TPR) repeat protein